MNWFHLSKNQNLTKNQSNMLLTSLVIAGWIVVFGISYLVMKFPYDVVKEGEYWYLLRDGDKIYKSDNEQDCWDRISDVY